MSETGTSLDLTSTRQGHKRPDIATARPACFLHTATAIYALDDEGICLYVNLSDRVGTDGASAQGAQRCRGAQYVACFDTTSPEGMVAEPRPGSQALFIGRGTGTRMALLRTAPITSVEYTEEEAPTPPPSDVMTAVPSDGYDPRKTRLGMPAVRLP